MFVFERDDIRLFTWWLERLSKGARNEFRFDLRTNMCSVPESFLERFLFNAYFLTIATFSFNIFKVYWSTFYTFSVEHFTT